MLDDPLTAFRQIDRTLAAARLCSRPVYIELPRDMVSAPGYPVSSEPNTEPESDYAALEEAVAETVVHLNKSAEQQITHPHISGPGRWRSGVDGELGTDSVSSPSPLLAGQGRSGEI